MNGFVRALAVMVPALVVALAPSGPSFASATPLAVPGAPTGLTATAGSSSVTLSWAAPASDGGAVITSYVVYQGTSPGRETTSAPVTGTRCTVAGLANGTAYYFRVAAVSAVGPGAASAEAAATPQQAAVSVQAAVPPVSFSGPARQPTAVVSLTSPTPSRQLITALGALAVAAVIGALALGLWGRRRSRQAGSPRT